MYKIDSGKLLNNPGRPARCSVMTETVQMGVGEGGLGGKGYMYDYDRFTLLYSRSQHKIVKQVPTN